MKKRAPGPLDIGSLERFGDLERKLILAILDKCGLKRIAVALGCSMDSDLENHLAKLTWRAIRGRRTSSQSRREATSEFEQFYRALVVAQGREPRDPPPDHGGRPGDIERHVLLAELREVERLSTGRVTAYTFDPDADEYRGPLITMLYVVESAVALAQGSIMPEEATLARFIARAKA